MVEIEFRNVRKSFIDKQTSRPITAVTNVSLSINKGEVVSLIGPSGCGKSTLLNMGSGLYQPTEGEVYVAGKLVTRPVREVAFMLQKDLLMQWRTIEDNVALGLEIAGVSKGNA
ncbi:ATP-binding cassette domain-containing protein [Neopusillimonas aromaticivorans]|uniref:ATP-binding cassette domain-containing protein n=1 Tax=Neopusillimonas aromaticivorans TaxID=2979868 RepID=UPI0025924F37|nr:ATP-binding cassette domain-containing protein [Neopusillimonas aromaticivorans]WJJ93678.1 ATP-binding cassette domain-containing protein [Neopusillimonas aromaticivorans]